MKKKYILLITITLIMVVFNSYNYFSDTDGFNEELSEEINLLEAYQIGIDYASQYDGNSQLLELNSIDDHKPSGENGSRSSWHLLFNLPSNKEGLAITIENREIVKEIVLENFDSSYQNEIYQDQINFNSNEIIEVAISEFDLKKGNGQDVIFSGYHYKLIEDEGIQFLTVVGTIDSKMAEIHFNAQTGEQIGWTETN